ncbi:hypothetical protein HOY82DRAFT_96234 [Tuber indicum]|nr:hypothetical protein HOY82DRAFT_96234 [Tuber indicum]
MEPRKKSVKDYEKVAQGWGKAFEKNERKKREKGRKEEKMPVIQHNGEVERLRLEKERMERQERLLKGILELPVCDATRQSTTSPKGSIPSLSPSLSPSRRLTLQHQTGKARSMRGSFATPGAC